MRLFFMQLGKIFAFGLFFYIPVYAEESPLIDWRFSQQLDLPESIAAASRVNTVFIENDLILISHPNLDLTGQVANGNNCGLALLFAMNNQGRFDQVQSLSAVDFGLDCVRQDGFGFSVDYSDGVLVIGAPGQVFAQPEAGLSNGEAFVYYLDGDRLMPAARIPGVGEAGNLAWGTRVETDGDRILIQGNQEIGVEQRLAHNRALPQTVNLLESDDSGSWQITSQFIGTSTIYGHDFLIQNDVIFINSHEFQGFSPGFINVPVQNRYRSEVEVYQVDGSGYELSEVINIGVLGIGASFVTRRDGLQDRDQLFWENNRLITFTPRPGLFDGSADIQWFEIDEVEGAQEISAVTLFGQGVKLIDGLVDFDGVAVYERPRLQRPDGLVTYAPVQTDAPRSRRQTLKLGSNQILFGDGDTFQLNANNTQLLRTAERQGIRQISVLNASPALDPAITGLWWFGPQFNGQGLTLEVLRNNRLLLHWFTYDSAGNQMWVRGVGALRQGAVELNLVRARGPRFPIGEFDSDDRVVESWGIAEIGFSDCRNGVLSYSSDEFGDGVLPIQSLVDNDLLCDRGLLINEQSIDIGRRFTARFTGESRSMIGSSFDITRSGEGFIFMPAQIDANDPRSRNMVGLWLTYNQQGDQAWYYLGILEDCAVNITGCRWRLTGQPRSTIGPVFGDNYNPADRMTIPWGSLGDINENRRSEPPRTSFLSIDFDNPDGAGTLVLEKATDPIGYE